MTPILAEIDGTQLILKRVLFGDGNLYDIRIWKWDREGNTIPPDEKFSEATLREIQTIAKDIFNNNPLPIRYTEEPEECVAIRPDQSSQAVSEEICERAQRIHELLTPSIRGGVGGGAFICPTKVPPPVQAPTLTPLVAEYLDMVERLKKDADIKKEYDTLTDQQKADITLAGWYKLCAAQRVLLNENIINDLINLSDDA